MLEVGVRFSVVATIMGWSQSLPDILRKCLLLGHQLKNEQLKTWANQELNGYKSAKDVPEYRIVPALAKGDFFGPLRAQYRGAIIPSVALKDEHRQFAERVYLAQSVSAYADLLRNDEPSGARMIFYWDPNMVAFYQDKLMEGGFICHRAWQEVPRSALIELLDTVRNRTLNMALQIKDELGTSYADLSRIESKEAATKIENIIFQNTGGNTNVAFGQGSVDASGQKQTNIAVRDRKALDEVLSQAGLSDTDLEDLTEAMKAGGSKPGNKVAVWVKEKAGKVLSGGAKVGTKIGSDILTAWIKQHYGL